MKFEKFNSEEYNIVKQVFNNYPLMDINLAYLVESFIYKTILIGTESDSDSNYYTKYVLKYGNIDGEHVFRNKDLLVLSYYKDGVRTGEWKKYKNNILIEKMSFNNGKLDGEYLEYFPSGVLKIKRTYINHSLDRELMYDENGHIRLEQCYKNGIRHGYCNQYRNGILIKFSNYYFDKLQGECITFYDNGQILEKYYYDIIDDRSVLHGPAYVYNEMGKEVYHYVFEFGVKKTHIKFDYMGKIELLIQWKDHVTYESFKSYEKGKLRHEFFYDNLGKVNKAIHYIDLNNETVKIVENGYKQ